MKKEEISQEGKKLGRNLDSRASPKTPSRLLPFL
jgi:hypothetical protein